MHLIYLDESGNTGMNLKDKQQPVFVLCALIIEERCWKSLETDLRAAVNTHLPDAANSDHEIHATDLRTGRGPFSGKSVTERIAFRNEWFAIAARHGVKVVSRSIAKHKLASWIERNLGSGVGLNPHRPAFPLVARVVNAYLASLKPPQLGIFISDENREIVSDVEQTIRLLRVKDGTLNLGQIIEKGFFVDSRMSLPLQLTDMVALTVRKHAESIEGAEMKSFDAGAFDLVRPLVYTADEKFDDVMEWLTGEEKKKRPGT